jgi:hypothetical protein
MKKEIENKIENFMRNSKSELSLTVKIHLIRNHLNRKKGKQKPLN